MNPSDIRNELEQIADKQKEGTYADYLRLAKAWASIKGQMPTSYHEVIESRLRALYRATLLPALLYSQEEDPPHLRSGSLILLAVSQANGYGTQDGDIEALALDSKREVMVDRAEAPRFIADCIGWRDIEITYDDGTTFDKADRFEEGFGVCLFIDSEKWDSWLKDYELLDEDATSLQSLGQDARRTA